MVCSFSLCCFRLCEVFDGDSLAGIRFVMRMPRHCRDLHIANKAVVDHDPLGTILADLLRFKHINVVDQLHKPLITDLSNCIVLIELFIEPGNGIVPGHRLLQFLLTAPLFRQKLLVGLSGQQLGKGIFVVAQIFYHLHQGRLHHFRLPGGGHRAHASQQRG